jgi:hypothetical protein
MSSTRDLESLARARMPFGVTILHLLDFPTVFAITECLCRSCDWLSGGLELGVQPCSFTSHTSRSVDNCRNIAISLVERGWALGLLLSSIPLSTMMAEQMRVKLFQHVRFEIPHLGQHVELFSTNGAFSSMKRPGSSSFRLASTGMS